jgi:predicted transcriptional regulator
MILMDIDLLCFLKDGKYRIKVLKLLDEKPMISSELANIVGVNRTSMSRILKVLKEKNLVISNSNKTRTVIYSLSNLGKKIIKNEL